MNKLTTVFILISFGLINGLTYDQKQFAQILPMILKVQTCNNERKIHQPVVPPNEKGG